MPYGVERLRYVAYGLHVGHNAKSARWSHRTDIIDKASIAQRGIYHPPSTITLYTAYQCDATLDDAEVASIVAFLRTLTGEYQGRKLTSDNKQEN